MNIDKLVQVVFYLLKKYNYRLNYTKLIKLLYLSDRESLSQTGESITGDEFYSMDNGPVLSELYNLILDKGNAPAGDQQVWNRYFQRTGYDLICCNRSVTDEELCEYEELILDNIDSKYHDKSYSYMIDEVHKKEVCPEWKNPHGTHIYISEKEILKNLNFTDKEISCIQENKEIYEEEFKKLMVIV